MPAIFPSVGGAGLSHLDFALVERELGRGSMALTHFLGDHKISSWPAKESKSNVICYLLFVVKEWMRLQ